MIGRMKNISGSNANLETPPVTDPVKERANFHWISSLALAVLVFLVALLIIEWSLRASGAEPNFRDSQARWSTVREAAGLDRDADAIALLGASRIRAAISLSETETRYPDQGIYPLGYVGRAPCAVLQDLAEETKFRGTIIVSLSSNWVDCRPAQNQMHDIVSRYHNQWNWARKIDASAANLVTQNLVTADPDHSIRSLLSNLREFGQFTRPQNYEVTRRNRQLEMDFSQFSEDDLAQMQSSGAWAFIGRVEAEERRRRENWLAGIAAFNEAIETINARGGQVILVRLPTSGPLEQAEEEHFPRDQFWDEMARRLPAIAVLHYQDYPALSAFATPDGNHLDFRDAPRFTSILFDLLEQEGVSLSRKSQE